MSRDTIPRVVQIPGRSYIPPYYQWHSLFHSIFQLSVLNKPQGEFRIVPVYLKCKTGMDPRIKQLNHKKCVDGHYVLYWMQQSQRAEENLALEYAVRKANSLRLPVVVGFGLAPGYPDERSFLQCSMVSRRRLR
jgi:hypothetical protein